MTASMTRKHFKAIAAEFDLLRPYANTPEGEAIRKLCAERVASALRQFNPLFDREKFLDACGVK